MRPQGAAPLILVVDDDPLVRCWVCTVLEEEGYCVAEAGDGNEALAIIRRDGPVAVVLDVYMPGKEGLETILELRKERYPIKVLATSGGPIDGYDVLKVAKLFGAADVLAKPYSAVTLVERVAQLLNEREAATPEPAGATTSGAPV